MKITKRRIELTIEKSQKLRVQEQSSELWWCEGCGRKVSMILPDAAAETTGFTIRSIYRMIEANKIHFREGREGGLLVCLESLLQKERFNEKENSPDLYIDRILS